MTKMKAAARRSQRQGGLGEKGRASHTRGQYAATSRGRQGTGPVPGAAAQPRQATTIASAVESFLIDRASRGLSPRTVEWYAEKLRPLTDHLASAGISRPEAITAQNLRTYLLALARTHNPGGVHAGFRALRAFLRFWELDVEPAGWKNPMRKLRPPRVPTVALEPVPLASIRAMLNSCLGTGFTQVRDRAVLLGLLDTGCRASEFLDLCLGDVDLATGEARVACGKGGKARVVFFGEASRAALRSYLEVHPSQDLLAPLWVTRQGTRLTYAGLREIVRRRARLAHVQPPSLHSFRRAFALGCLRNGMDIYSLQRLMGHSTLDILRRYLAQTTADLQRAHAERGPVDCLLIGEETQTGRSRNG
ncbi:MAG: tyrosine-type recombinase/integrase [Anaerolineae bacterium]